MSYPNFNRPVPVACNPQALPIAFTRKPGILVSFLIILATFFSTLKTEAQTPGYSKGGGTSQTNFLLNSTSAFKTQFFYLPTDFSTTPIQGNITRIYFRNNIAGASGTYNNFQVFMGQTQATTFPGSGSLEFFTGLTQVVNSPSKVITGNATAGDWFFIDLDMPFNYDNTRTLIVEIRIGSYNGGISVFSTSSGVVPNHKKLRSSDVTATTGTQDTNGWPNFGIDITPLPACSGTPTAGTAVSSSTTACVGQSFELSLTGTSMVSGLTYQWQSSPNGTSGWTDIAGATSNRFTTTQTATTFYRANVSCGANTAASSSVQVTSPTTSMSGTFTIDKNSPVSATNYQSLSAFVSDMTCKGVSGPVVVNVIAGSGPYNEQVIFTPVTGASATNTITFNGNGNKISFANNSTNRPVIMLNDADFIKLDNFQIEATDTDFGWGIQFTNGADNNTISNNTITIATTNSLEAASAGIFFTNSNNSASTGNTGSNNIISGNTINGGYTGIYLNSILTATGNNQIRNNMVKDFMVTGIRVTAANGTMVEGNDISRPTATLGNEFNGIFLTGNSQQTTISKNRIHNTHDAATGAASAVKVNGIYIQSSDAPTGSENIVKNNLLYAINNTGAIDAIYNSGSDGAFYYHNTINLDNTANTGNKRGFFQTSAASNIRFINNIVSVSGGTGTNHALYFDALTSAITSDNNVLYAPNGNIGNSVGTDYMTLASWKAVNGGAFDQNSISADPNFVNIAAGNLQPGNSTINNTGQPVAAVTDDITGAPRSTTMPDPGAYEFVTPTINDAGVTAILAPVSPVAPGSSIVQVVIKNYGSAALTSASITWSVNSVAQTPYAWTGNLPSGSSALVTIGNYTFTAGAFTLEVCTSNPNGQTDGNTSNDCLSISGNSCLPLSGNFTIDKNNPASATNFQSLTDAVQALNSCGVSGPVTFSVVSGTGPYNEQLALTAIPGTNAVNTVKFEGNGNTIAFTGTTSNRPVIRLDGTDFVTINNFMIEPTDPTYAWGVHLLNGADNNVISNNTITNNSTNTSEANTIGIVFTNSVNQVNIGGNTGNNNTISGNTIIGGFKAIQVNGNNAVASNNQLKNNIIRDFYSVGIRVSSARGTLVEGNDLSRPGRTSVSGSTWAINITDNAIATIVSKNRIHNTHDVATSLTGSVYGVYIASADAPTGLENIIKNNLIYDINNNGTIYALYNFNSDGAYFYHNTIDLSRAANTGNQRGMFLSQVLTNVRFNNNIVTITAGTGTKNAIYIDAPTSSINSNNNVLFVPGGNIGSITTTTFATLANWQTANSNAYDQNSVSSDPTYVNAATGNFQPTSPLVNNIGQPGTGVTDDITGAPRSASTPDAGAYEFGIIPNDVGVIAVSGPVTTGCGLTNAETITVTIRNFGSATQTSIPVTFSVNGTTIATETFTGSLAPNATITYTFTATANLSAFGGYTIVGSTALAGDGEASNDATTLNLANALFASLPVVVDFENTGSNLANLKQIIQPNASIFEDTAASFGATSTKGMIMDGKFSFAWTIPAGIIDPWTANPAHFSGAYFCMSPGTGNANDTLYLSFDLKQLFKQVNANTNFRVTVNGTQVGPTYRPPFSGTPINWQKIKVDLSAYLNQPTIEIGLESNVAEEYNNGNGPANLIDNIEFIRVAGPTTGTGIKENALQNNVTVFPNPSTGLFNVKVPATTRNYTAEITDLTGKIIMQQVVKNNSGTEQLNLNGTAKGIYILKITSEGNVATRKLIVE